MRCWIQVLVCLLVACAFSAFDVSEADAKDITPKDSKIIRPSENQFKKAKAFEQPKKKFRLFPFGKKKKETPKPVAFVVRSPEVIAVEPLPAAKEGLLSAAVENPIITVPAGSPLSGESQPTLLQNERVPQPENQVTQGAPVLDEEKVEPLLGD